MAAVTTVAMWKAIALIGLAVAEAFVVVSSSPRERSVSTQLASEYGASARTRTQDDYIDINRESGGPIVRYDGPTIRPLSNYNAGDCAGWISENLVVCQSQVDAVQVLFKSEGRPIDADIDLWNGPDNTPHKMRVYVEDGARRTFSAIIGTPRGPNSIAVRNIGQLEFPLDAVVRPDMQGGLAASIASVVSKAEVIQGGSVRTWSFNPVVQSVAVIIKTDGRPLNSRIELLMGPNNSKQVVEIYTEDGVERPFFAIVETSEAVGSVIRIKNTAPLEFPVYASVAPYTLGEYDFVGDSYSFNEWPMM
ncbi:hypothetical protein QTG54_007079 [Skeletonema marinoi]|uniref:Uncharacterized protein n=1 Tax=Skeletonema marinoi TaxID=267567 RepID=A0AAD9DDY0_9STRA|nr:hypothetical protein QTG54_007079 [Skeletonema marinoi]